MWQKSLLTQPARFLLPLFLFLPYLWACWLPFLPCCPVRFITSFLGHSWPTYFTLTSCYAYGSADCHSCHLDPLDLLPLSLGSLGLFTLLLPLVVPMSLLAVISAILAHWAYYLFPWASRPICLTFISFISFFYCLFSFLGFFCCGPFCQKGASI